MLLKVKKSEHHLTVGRDEFVQSFAEGGFYINCITKNKILQLKKEGREKWKKVNKEGRKEEEAAKMSSKVKFLKFGKTACSSRHI